MDLTWEQMDLYSREIRRCRLEETNLAVGPLVAVRGGRWKGYRMADEKDAGAVSMRNGGAEVALAQHGFQIRDEPAPKAEPTE